ncbi:MAG: hypothetical protein HQL03_11335 [Nitrospirae bacterium]|nr:hypothetical protein [Nitrospirota bacterium]
MTEFFYRKILPLIKDCEAGKGDIQATTIKVDSLCIGYAQDLLQKNSGQYKFGSHDALIAGSLIAARDRDGVGLEMVTSDKGLKSVLAAEGIACFDPSDP